jgi:uncharacterized repeat protein (TIGR01451 family)
MMCVLRLFALLMALFGFATAADAQLAFELRTGNNTTGIQSMAIDSNNCAGAGPRAAYVGGIVTNSGPTTVTNISATLAGLGSGFFLSSGQPAVQSIGSLGPGQSTGVYWFVGYGCGQTAVSAPTVSISSSAPAVSRQLSLRARPAISANAGGKVMSSTLGPGAVVGQTIYFDATYEFGGANSGDEYFLQPAGGQAFDAACFRLVGATIRSSNVLAVTVNTVNKLYFVAGAKQSGSGYTATVRYYFEYQCAGASTTARPYAVQTSGSDNIKYTGNFDGAGSISISFPGATNPFTITKTSDSTSGLAGVSATVKYTVTVTNPSANASRISQFVDTLPSGASFLALDPLSDVTSANSSRVPAAGATGTLTFTGRQDQSYLIAAGGTVNLIYTVQMPSAAGTYVNSAQAQFGSAATPTASASFSVVAPAALTMVKSSQAATDPLNGTTNPKLIPGGRANYTISIANPNPFPTTADSIVVVDAKPTNTQLFVGNISGSSGGPIRFVDGSTASGLTYTFTSLSSTTDDVDFSNNGGTTWTYVPTANANGVDPAVTHIRIRPKGAMAANSSFSLTLGFLID